MRTIEQIEAEIRMLDAASHFGNEWKQSRREWLNDELRVALAADIPLDRLREICTAEQDGRCVVMPCKVDDTVYVNSGCLFYHDDAPYTPCKVVVIKSTKRETSMHLRPLCESAAGTRYHLWFGVSSIGKTVFLSREEAELALRKE